MLDEATNLDLRGGRFAELVTAGAAAGGAFHCATCGYGVAVQATLPQCPMCGGKSWERAPFAGRPPLPGDGSAA